MANGGHRQVDFTRPPVVETILGVQFPPVRGLTLAHLGLFWGEVRKRYPSSEVRPPLPPAIEDLASSPSPAKVGLKISQAPDARFWFVDATSTQLVQLQVDRFIRNWRKGGPPYDAYPRYETLRPRFEQDWTVLLAFLEREGLGPPEANMCEVTYINHVDLGAGWESLGEAHRALRFLKVQGQREVLPEMPEAFSMNLRYLMPERRGRLHVSAQPVIRRSDGRPVLQLTLTARGKPESPNLRDIAAWFDLGHQWVVHGFVDLTTPEMHETWGRT